MVFLLTNGSYTFTFISKPLHLLIKLWPILPNPIMPIFASDIDLPIILFHVPHLSCLSSSGTFLNSESIYDNVSSETDSYRPIGVWESAIPFFFNNSIGTFSIQHQWIKNIVL